MSSASTTSKDRSSALTLGLAVVVVVVAVVFAFSSSAFLPNNWYAAFKAIHVSFAVLWVGGGLLLTILALEAERAGDPGGIAAVAKQATFVGERIFAPAGLIVFLSGVAMLINTDLGWGKLWVIIGLVGYAATFSVGIGVLSPLAKKIKASIEQNGTTHPETVDLIRRILLIARLDVAVLLVVVLDMATKPFA